MEDETGQDLFNSLSDGNNVATVGLLDAERRRQHMTHTKWRPDLKFAEVLRLSGKFWKNHGFSINATSYLYPEEVMYLHEVNKAYVEFEGSVLTQHELYQLVLGAIPHACYLTYLRLKALNYICSRHSGDLRCFDSEKEIYDYLRSNPASTLLTALVAFNVYAYDSMLMKRDLPDTAPTGYVVIMTGSETLSGRILMELLREAEGVPILFAVLLPSGSVVLEEFTDATISLSWKKSTESDIK